MIDGKKISPIGNGVPTRGIEKHTTESITDNSEKIKCVLQNPGEISELTCISNSVNAVSDIVQGTPAAITIGIDSMIMIYNRYGYDRVGNKLDANIKLDDGIIISGTVIITTFSKHTNDMTIPQVQAVRAWLLKHTI